MEIFGWHEDPDADRVLVVAKHAGQMSLAGAEYARFMRFVNLRSIAAESAPLGFGASEDAGPARPGPASVRVSAP